MISIVQMNAYVVLDSLVVSCGAWGATTPEERHWTRLVQTETRVGALSADDPRDMAWLTAMTVLESLAGVEDPWGYATALDRRRLDGA